MYSSQGLEPNISQQIPPFHLKSYCLLQRAFAFFALPDYELPLPPPAR